MLAAGLLLAFVSGAWAKGAVDVSPAKSSAAQRVYDMARAEGFKPAVPPDEFGGRQRTWRLLQAPNTLSIDAVVTADTGSPGCLVDLPSSPPYPGKIRDAVAMGLPMPFRIVDRRCSGKKKDISLEFLSRDRKDPGPRAGEMTQQQLDILFSLVLDCLKNGV